MKNFFKQCYYAVRYGQWAAGWEMYEGKPKFGFYTRYYDGRWAAFHLWKFWVSVYW